MARRQDGAVNNAPASPKATASCLLEQTLVFFGSHRFSSCVPALLHLGHSGTQLLTSLIISSPPSVGLQRWTKGHDGSQTELEAESKLTPQHCYGPLTAESLGLP